ncbi:hypothetical protein KUA55_07810 [Enterococcus sp. ALS3]|uniref:YcxB-like protein domain-containing protein n=1 Tax=Enterococcus alishanensis TaxID=1303817 RepID=A0ABS6TCH0_9ENTE|nr:hypothetical protein [Enterococcus alishanensis]MBV7390581.1 hypothetical protein [Enterococcus alishanensis]
MDFAKFDFDYYERSIKGMYQNYFSKRIGLASGTLILIVLYSLVFRESLWLNGLLVLILAGIIFYLSSQRQKFPEIYQQFLAENLPEAKIERIQESEYSFDVMRGNEVALRINKKGMRNFPAQNKQYTLMVGFEKTFFAKQPLEILYYDVLDLTYEESYRLKRNGYSNVPRFLRRFSWGNIKSSIGNGFSFILGNLFLLFILFRLLRYLLVIFRQFM